MRESRISESQILGVLKDGEAGVRVAEITREHSRAAEPMRMRNARPTERAMARTAIPFRRRLRSFER